MSTALPEGVRELDHTADAAIEIEAPGPEVLFDRAARALRALSLPEGTRLSSDGAETRTVELEASDPAVLLVRWLSEVLYRIDTLGHAYESAEITFEDGGLRARVRETRLAEPGAQVKAVTYHGVECGPRSDGGWGARVIFDI